MIVKIETVLAAMATNGHPMKVCQALRTAAAQHLLWRQGRDPSHPGMPIVTHCDGYARKSRHQAAQDGFGHAVDCCFSGPDPFGSAHPWSLYGATVEAQGLIWGGRFSTLVDLGHAELPSAP